MNLKRQPSRQEDKSAESSGLQLVTEQAGPSSERTRILGLDAIRFVCALAVVLNHCIIVIPRTTPLLHFISVACGVAVNGPAGVIVFFVLSGFCIHFPQRNVGLSSTPQFLVRRFVRVALPAMVATWIASAVGIWLSLLSASILWSIDAELFYYLIYPVLLRVQQRFGWGWILACSYIGALGVLCLTPTSLNYGGSGLMLTAILGLPCWLLGCCLAQEYDRLPSKHGALPIWGWRLLAWAGSSICLILRFHGSISYAWTLTLFGILVYFWLKQEMIHYRDRKPWGWLEWCGKWSYSVYLFHLIGEHLSESLGMGELGKLFVFRYAGIFIGSLIFYAVVEKPSHSLARRLGALIGKSTSG